MRIGRRTAAIAALATLALAGCTGRAVDGTGTRAVTSGSAPGSAPPQYYLSLGDSYAAGYQPLPSGGGHTTRAGFPYQVVADAAAKGYAYKLVNLACGGATTTSVLQTPGCEPHLLGPGAASYAPLTQAAAATQFLHQHRGQVGLITVSIGGNDILGCGVAPNLAGCVTTAVQRIGTNLGTLLAELRSAAGPNVRIVGTTYPNLFLGQLVSHGSIARGLVDLSVAAFKALLNPELARVYRAAGGQFVDVTAATGGYGSLSQLTTLPPYGRIPVPVARICTLTWFCRLHDVHPTPAGHALIAKLIVGTLPHR